LYTFLIAYWLYKGEWRNILGLSGKGITRKIVFKSFRVGLLISLLINASLYLLLYIFNVPLSQPFGDEMTLFELYFGAIIMAPIMEEIMFRGFVQGILQKNYICNENKTSIKIIIVVAAFLFAIAHVRYIAYTETLQWVASLLGIFIIGGYLGYLRYKYQSIVPSIFAHFGANMSMAIVPIFLLIFVSVSQPGSLGIFNQKMDQMKYRNDSIYNFDPNNIEVIYNAQRKFLAFNNAPHPEFEPYIIKRKSVALPIYYDIDTSGFVYNIRLDTAKLRKDYPEGAYTSSEIEEEAFRLVASFPQHKPYIRDGKKTETISLVYVLIYY
jgi:membrane protease YdiL (CAAX protease family)